MGADDDGARGLADHQLHDMLEAAVGMLCQVTDELEQRGIERPWFLPTSDTVAYRAMRRLGIFTAEELGVELRLSRSAAAERIRDAVELGLVCHERGGRGRVPTAYRWTVDVPASITDIKRRAAPSS